MSSQGIDAGQVRDARNQQKDSTPPPVVKPCTKCWIEVSLLDEEEHGVAREPYWIKLPDGAVREGRLDDNGFVRLDGIPCGTCIVRFSGMDEEEVQSKTAVAAGKMEWIQITLLDETGQPVADEPYSIDLPDGSNRQGQLDAKGRARIDGIPGGNCLVRYPNIDAADFL